MFFLAFPSLFRALCTPSATVVSITLVLRPRVEHSRGTGCHCSHRGLPPGGQGISNSCSCCLFPAESRWSAGREAWVNDLRTDVGYTNTDSQDTLVPGLRRHWANQELYETSPVILREKLVLPKCSVTAYNYSLKIFIFYHALFISDSFVFLESGTRNNFLAVKIQTWTFKLVDPTCLWLRGLEMDLNWVLCTDSPMLWRPCDESVGRVMVGLQQCYSQRAMESWKETLRFMWFHL